MSDEATLAGADAVYLDASALPKIDIEVESQSRLLPLLLYFSTIPVFCSFVGFDEFFRVAGRSRIQKQIAVGGYLRRCRALLFDVETEKLRHVEPVRENEEFTALANRLIPKHGRRGGGDGWHIMAALQLKSQHPSMVFLSYDRRLVAAASSEGLKAVDGNRVDPPRLEVVWPRGAGGLGSVRECLRFSSVVAR